MLEKEASSLLKIFPSLRLLLVNLEIVLENSDKKRTSIFRVQIYLKN